MVRVDGVGGRWSDHGNTWFVIKVHHSCARKAVLLRVSGEVGRGDALRAAARIALALRNMGHGYTLIEVFKGACRLSGRAGLAMAVLARTCYERGRIWRVVRISIGGGQDPGLRILHRTRWDRNVPEIDADSVGGALDLAEREAEDNLDWAED